MRDQKFGDELLITQDMIQRKRDMWKKPWERRDLPTAPELEDQNANMLNLASVFKGLTLSQEEVKMMETESENEESHKWYHLDTF